MVRLLFLICPLDGFLLIYLIFFIMDILHKNSSLARKLVNFFSEPNKHKTPFSNINL